MKQLLLFLFLLLSATAFCQHTISGQVISEKDVPLSNASVFIPSTKSGVFTNEKGGFILPDVPAGNLSFAVSYVGYQVVTVRIDPATKTYLIKLQPLDNNLQTVIIRSYDRQGWKKWGDLFTLAFIGSSAYAGNCTIVNKDIIRFVYKEKTQQLLAFANEPLLIINKDLGYEMQVDLVNFTYELSDGFVDYQTYTLFKEMDGDDEEKKTWQKNRLKVYALSLLHFMRSVYSKNIESEGYQIRLIERKFNTEKQRVQQLYATSFDRINDSLHNNNKSADAIVSLVEKSFRKDSLRYYQKTLNEDDKTEKIRKKPAVFEDIASETDSNTVVLTNKEVMQVTYTRIKEPEEYAAFKNKKNFNQLSDVVSDANKTSKYPVTELSLHQAIPVTIYENGYFTNTDLLMDGFWGWWEKMATKLPYEYNF